MLMEYRYVLASFTRRVGVALLACVFATVMPAAHSVTPEQPNPEETAKSGESDRPPTFDCERVSWIGDCEQVNEQIRENPGQPLRATTKDGLELIIAPHTPRAQIRHLVLETPEAAEQYAIYLDRIIDHNKRASQRLQAAQDRLGLSLTVSSLQKAIRENSYSSLDLDNDMVAQRDVRIYFFYDSKCSSCRFAFPELANLKRKYPDLLVSALQLDANPAFTQQMNERYGLDAVVLKGEALARWAPQIDEKPTLLIEADGGKDTPVARAKLEGFADAAMIERAIVRLLKESDKEDLS